MPFSVRVRQNYSFGLGQTYSFGLPRVSFVNIYLFVCSFLFDFEGWMWDFIYQFLIITYHFTLMFPFVIIYTRCIYTLISVYTSKLCARNVYTCMFDIIHAEPWYSILRFDYLCCQIYNLKYAAPSRVQQNYISVIMIPCRLVLIL